MHIFPQSVGKTKSVFFNGSIRPWQNSSITRCLSQLKATARWYNGTLVQCRCIDPNQLASFHWPDSSPAFVTCDRQKKYYVSAELIQVQFTFYNCTWHVLHFICFLWPPGKGLASGYFIKAQACSHDAILLVLSQTVFHTAHVYT